MLPDPFNKNATSQSPKMKNSVHQLLPPLPHNSQQASFFLTTARFSLTRLEFQREENFPLHPASNPRIKV